MAGTDGMNLISTFVEVVTTDDGVRLADALRALNASLGTTYSNSRLREWERGDRRPTPQVVDYMLGIVLPALLAKEGVSPSRVKALVRKCRLPSA